MEGFVVEQGRCPIRPEDQAAGLRRLFKPRTARLLPVLVGSADLGEATWLARLGEAFARAGQRTLLIDAARTRVAAALGLRARFDLMHVLDGDRTVADAQLDAAPGLSLLPAARAFGFASASGIQLPALLAPALDESVDVVLLLLPAASAPLLPAGDVAVPVLPTRESVAATANLIGQAASVQGSLSFRLLFLGMERAAATTLSRRLTDSIGARSRTTLRLGAVAPLPRDLAQVVAATGEFALLRLAAVQPAETGETR